MQKTRSVTTVAAAVALLLGLGLPAMAGSASGTMNCGTGGGTPKTVSNSWSYGQTHTHTVSGAQTVSIPVAGYTLTHYFLGPYYGYQNWIVSVFGLTSGSGVCI